MTKIFTFVLLLLAVQYSLQTPDDEDGDDKGKSSKRAAFKKVLDKCKSHLDEDTKKEFKEKKFSETDGAKKFFNCFLKEIKMIDENGEPQEALIKKWIKAHTASEADAEKLYKDCIKKTEPAEESAFKMVKCVKDSGLVKNRKKSTKKSE